MKTLGISRLERFRRFEAPDAAELALDEGEDAVGFVLAVAERWRPPLRRVLALVERAKLPQRHDAGVPTSKLCVKRVSM